MNHKYYILSLSAIFFYSMRSAYSQTDIATHPYNVLNYTLTLDLYKNYSDPFPLDYTGVEEITLQAESSLDSLVINASSSSLTIDSVSDDATSFFQTTDTLSVTLKKTYKSGETIHVKIYYQHRDRIDGVFYGAKKYVFTDSKPEGAHHWFVCWDNPDDKATTDITAKVPSDAQLVSNGTLVDSMRVNDTLYYHWVSNDPVATYLIAIASRKNYTVDNLSWHYPTHPKDSIPVMFYYFSDENPAGIEAVYDTMLNYLSSLFGDYPFDKVAFASANSYLTGTGTENQTINIICYNCWYESLIINLLTHHWFGDLITPETWADIWLSEGFSKYGEVLWAEHQFGSTAAKDTLENYRNYYLAENPGWPIYDSSWAIKTPGEATLLNKAITYSKGACVVDQLRYVLGDSTFFKLLNAYTTNDTFRFSNASVNDLMSFTNSLTGENYDWFFNEWLLEPNHPVYDNVLSISNPASGVWNVTESINQIQSNAPFFQMPIELKFNFSDGSDTLISVFNDVNHQVFDFSFSKSVDTLIFDPNDHILLKEFGYNTAITETASSSASWCFVSPNPAKENVTISYYTIKGLPVSIAVYNNQGIKVSNLEALSQSTGWNRMNLDCTKLPSGLYYLNVRLKDEIAVKKIEILK
ncbi:MAG: T9SS type A sorting domain-containing protein [Chitinophagales bacterium]|nr:T9SS type A sorting domain-containing protein [Chitinophagales bacterium]